MEMTKGQMVAHLLRDLEEMGHALRGIANYERLRDIHYREHELYQDQLTHRHVEEDSTEVRFVELKSPNA